MFIDELLNTVHYQPDDSMAAVLRRAQAPGIRDSKARTLVEGNRGPCSTSGNLFSHFSESRGFTVQAHSSVRQEAGKRVGNKCVAFDMAPPGERS